MSLKKFRSYRKKSNVDRAIVMANKIHRKRDPLRHMGFIDGFLLENREK